MCVLEEQRVMLRLLLQLLLLQLYLPLNEPWLCTIPGVDIASVFLGAIRLTNTYHIRIISRLNVLIGLWLQSDLPGNIPIIQHLAHSLTQIKQRLSRVGTRAVKVKRIKFLTQQVRCLGLEEVFSYPSAGLRSPNPQYSTNTSLKNKTTALAKWGLGLWR